LFFFFCIAFLGFVFPLLPVSLDCPFFIAPSIFSKVSLIKKYLVPSSLIS
jgi:hypothetical protein